MTGIKTTKIMRNTLFVFMLLSFILPVAAKGKQAGKTLLTQGSVIGKRANKTIKLKRRSPIYEKDEIHVGNAGRAQFRMIDHALISLQENSILQIKEYKYLKKGDPSNSALLELLAGGLRTITGAIGKGNKKAYELRTPLATIGVRGTDYEVEIVSNGMFIATWEGVIHLQSHQKTGCNMLVGHSQPYMFVFVDRLGNCKGLRKVPKVFNAGHSSNISHLANLNLSSLKKTKTAKFEPLLQTIPIEKKTFDYKGLNIDLNSPATKITSKASDITTSTPSFKVGLDQYDLASTGQVSNFQQSVGGYKLSWGYWNQFSTSQAALQKNLGNNGMIWAAYDPSNTTIVAARTGTVRYDHVTNTLLNGSETVNNLQVQMDVNFESGNVTKGALSANTSSDTWVAVFDGKITSGDLDLQLNGASVIDSNSSTSSAVREATGFISGDFIGNNAEAIIGGFGLSEDNVGSNHIEGTFIVEEHK